MDSIRIINIALELWGSLFCVVACICCLADNSLRQKGNRSLLAVFGIDAFFLIFDALAGIFKGHTDISSIYIVHISNFCAFVLGYMLMAAFTDYLIGQLKDNSTDIYKYRSVIWGICCIAAFLVVVSQFNHMYYYIDSGNMYHRGEFFWLSQIWGILGMVVNAVLIIRYRKRMSRQEFCAFLCYIILPVIAMIIQIFVYGLALLNLVNTISLLIIFIIRQKVQNKRLRERELEISNNRVNLFMNQIQPEFLSNSLAAIENFCKEQPDKSACAIHNFSGYLQKSLEACACQKCIPFEQELELVKQYLMLEEYQLGDGMDITYQINAVDFCIPPFTLRMLMEHLLQNQISAKKKNGTVVICSSCEKNTNTIEILAVNIHLSEDNLFYEDISKRLAVMCGGTFKIINTKENEYKITILIPRR